LIFVQKTTNVLFEPPFGGVRGNVRTSSIARWKVRGRLPIRVNWTFSLALTAEDVTSGNLSKSAFLKGWVNLSANCRWKWTTPANPSWCQKTKMITLSCGIKITAVYSFICHKARVCQINRQNFDSEDRASIVASRSSVTKRPHIHSITGVTWKMN